MENLPRYHEDVQVYPISPPMGELRFGAKAVMYDRKTKQEIKLREHWGKTNGEAFGKAQAEMTEWLEQHKADPP